MKRALAGGAVPPAGRGTASRLPRLSFTGGSVAAALALTVASWAFLLTSDRFQTDFISIEAFQRAWDFVKDLLGVGAARRAFLEADEWADKGVLAVETLAMSILGIGIAALAALATFMFGARNVMIGELAPYGSWVSRGGWAVTRLFFVLTRGIPELLWALMIVFVFSPGILAGAVALGIHNAGVLGKLGSEVVEGLDTRPIRALRSSGAGSLQVLAYGVLPQALPRFVTFLFYRWEVVIRTTIVVGFVAAGGLGLEFRIAMSTFKFTEVTLILIWYLIIVLAVDVAAAYLRRLAD